MPPTKLIAAEDIYAPIPGARIGARQLVCRKGRAVPKGWEEYANAATAEPAADAAPADDADSDVAGVDYGKLTQKQLAALVKARGLDADSERKNDLIAALEAADEAGDEPSADADADGDTAAADGDD